MKTAKLSVLPIKDLNPAEYNPRKKLKPGDKEYEKIKHSIEEFGFADPVVVNSDMTIIGKYLMRFGSIKRIILNIKAQ